MPSTRSERPSSKAGRRAGASRRLSSNTPSFWWVAAAVIGVVVAGVVVVVSRSTGPDEGAGIVVGGGEVAHVHGLGIDPGDNTLYAATHYGLFRLPADGKAAQVGSGYQDTMGFTVVGSGHFLGSGHPDLKDETLRSPGKPPLLGLIESRDAGEKWKPMSLLGEADFHSLVAAHDHVYGYDSTGGRFMVSTDMKTWDTRSTLGIGTFAVDPGDAERVVASTEQGLTESLDGGRTWHAFQGPGLVFLSWSDDSGLWGAGSDGEVFQDVDGVGDWKRRGSLPGPPQALLVAGDDLYAAAEVEEATVIYQSSDRGKTWQVRYRDDA